MAISLQTAPSVSDSVLSSAAPASSSAAPGASASGAGASFQAEIERATSSGDESSTDAASGQPAAVKTGSKEATSKGANYKDPKLKDSKPKFTETNPLIFAPVSLAPADKPPLTFDLSNFFQDGQELGKSSPDESADQVEESQTHGRTLNAMLDRTAIENAISKTNDLSLAEKQASTPSDDQKLPPSTSPVEFQALVQPIAPSVSGGKAKPSDEISSSEKDSSSKQEARQNGKLTRSARSSAQQFLSQQALTPQAVGQEPPAAQPSSRTEHAPVQQNPQQSTAPENPAPQNPSQQDGVQQELLQQGMSGLSTGSQAATPAPMAFAARLATTHQLNSIERTSTAQSTLPNITTMKGAAPLILPKPAMAPVPQAQTSAANVQRLKTQNPLIGKFSSVTHAEEFVQPADEKQPRVEAVSAAAVGDLSLSNDAAGNRSYQTPDAGKPAINAAAEHFEIPDVKPAPQTSASHDIRVSIPDQRGGATEVRFVGNSNDVRVSVRTPDTDLAHTLRSNLNELTQRLADNGVQTELWRPGADQSFSHSNSQQNYDQNPSGGGNSSQEQRQRQQQQQQNDSRQNRPQWLEELEANFAPRS